LKGRKREITSIADMLAQSLNDLDISTTPGDVALAESAVIQVRKEEDDGERRRKRHSRKRKEKQAEQERIQAFDGMGRSAGIDDD
jgi:hypothetical protein